MTKNTTEEQDYKPIQQEIDYLKVFRILWSRWYWIAGSVIIAIIIGYVFLWYTPKTFSAQGTLKFDEKKNEISELLKGKYIYDKANRLEAESFVVKSRALILKAIGKIDYQVFFYVKGRVRTTEIYPNKPFDLEVIKIDSTNFNGGPFGIQRKGNKIKITLLDNEIEISKEYPYNQVINIKGNDIIIHSSNNNDDSSYEFKIYRKEDLIGRFLANLSTREVTKGSNIMAIAVLDQNPRFASDAVNAILSAYVDFDTDERSQSATQIIQFINQQLGILQNDVNKSQNDLQNFKKSNSILDPVTSAQEKQKRLTTLSDQLMQNRLESLLFNQVEQQIINNQTDALVNFNLDGSIEPLLNILINQLNLQIKDKFAKSNQYNENSKVIQDINLQIKNSKDAIARNIKQQKVRNKKTELFLSQEIQKVNNELKAIPDIETNFSVLSRNFNINEKVYSFLSEKKLEAEISRAAVLPGSSIVNLAQPSFNVITPQAGKLYTSAIILGLSFGMGLIIIVRLANPYIFDKEAVESVTSKPIIGVVRKFPGKIDRNNKQVLSIAKPKSVFAESIRSVRTNLSFLAGERNSHVICITSEIAGEGKSFLTVNLASTLALIDKKIIVVAADLRKSKLHKTFDKDNNKGLSTYLSNQHQLDQVIQRTEIENLDFIPAGPNPPNPSELLHSPRMTQIIKELSSRYDFVIIDTAPVGLVSDSIPIVRQADINLFVIRSGVSRFTAATIPERLSREYHLNNVVIVLNAFSDDALYSRYYSSNYAGNYYNNYYYSDYSGYYGSGYFEDDTPKWYEFNKKMKIKKNRDKD
jgi:capsular exopolysaccharide synthesis family protein